MPAEGKAQEQMYSVQSSVFARRPLFLEEDETMQLHAPAVAVLSGSRFFGLVSGGAVEPGEPRAREDACACPERQVGVSVHCTASAAQVCLGWLQRVFAAILLLPLT